MHNINPPQIGEREGKELALHKYFEKHWDQVLKENTEMRGAKIYYTGKSSYIR